MNIKALQQFVELYGNGNITYNELWQQIETAINPSNTIILDNTPFTFWPEHEPVDDPALLC